MQVDPDWWKNLFDELYLQTDARSVCNQEMTAREVDFLEHFLGLNKSASVLDLCGGQGRHALELSRRGFLDVTVLDYSSYLINLGIEKAIEANLNTEFVQGDARDTGLPGQKFDFIIVMASSFGYFPDEDENKKILGEAFRLLMSQGTLLLDLPDRDHAMKNFKPASSHRVNGDLTVNRTRQLGDDIIYSREALISEREGCIRESTYCIRLYSPDRIADLLTSTGFSSPSFKSDFMCREHDGDFGCMTNRMVVTAKKP
jgi:D-alanine-D-alanine ligase